jgi:hypothetical protein
MYINADTISGPTTRPQQTTSSKAAPRFTWYLPSVVDYSTLPIPFCLLPLPPTWSARCPLPKSNECIGGHVSPRLLPL